MARKSIKPTPEAKALSLFLMAYKSKDPIYKEKSKRINRLWYLVQDNELSKEDYMLEVQAMLDSYGNGEDKYCTDAQKVADQIMALRAAGKSS